MDQNILDRLGIRYDEGVARCGGGQSCTNSTCCACPRT